MITDPQPRAARRIAEYRRSDALLQLPLPPPGPLQEATRALFEALAAEQAKVVRQASAAILSQLSGFYEIPVPEVRVLGVRPHRLEDGHCTYELHGDYAPDTQRVRIWMRTAIREQVCAPRTFLVTLLHEVCHHLDCAKLAMPESYHTRGFFHRLDGLYHHSLGTPEDKRKRLVWAETGKGWRIDWSRSRPPVRR